MKIAWVAIGSSFVLAASLAVGCTPPGPTPPGPTSTANLSVDGHVITVTVPPGDTVTVASVNPQTVPLSATEFPLGPIAISVASPGQVGAVVHVTVTMPYQVNAVRKLVGGVWDSFFPDGETGATILPDGVTVSLDLKDGGRGDSDGVANGVIADPLLIGPDPWAMPMMTIGQPFNKQLTTTGGVGPVTWSLAPGATLPAGISFSSTGEFSGTPTSQFGVARVIATDSQGSTDSRLAGLFAQPASPPSSTSTGAPLPQTPVISFPPLTWGPNQSLVLAEGGTSSPPSPSRPFPPTLWYGSYAGNGSLAPLTTVNPDSFEALGLASLQLMVLPTIANDTIYAPGPIKVVDKTTGDELATLESSSTFQRSAISVHGLLPVSVAISDADGLTTRVWQMSPFKPQPVLTRTITTATSTHRHVWAGDRLILEGSDGAAPTGTVTMYDPQFPYYDKSFAVSGQSSCEHVGDYTGNGRLALTCGGSLVTVDVPNPLAPGGPTPGGLDVRVVAQTTCPAASCVRYGSYGARFSFFGNLLDTTEEIITPTETLNRLVIAPDQTGAAITGLTNPIHSFPAPGRVVQPGPWSIQHQ